MSGEITAVPQQIIVFPIDLPGPAALVELSNEIHDLRAGSEKQFELVVELPPGAAADEWEAAGATWILTDFGSPRPGLAAVREVVERGP